MYYSLIDWFTDKAEQVWDEIYDYFYWQYWKHDIGFFLSITAIVVIKVFMFNINFIPSPSMNPTLIEGDIAFVNKLTPLYEQTQRGDIVTFDRDKYLVKRVVGLAGDTVQIIKGVLHLNGKPLLSKQRLKDGDVDMAFPLAKNIEFSVSTLAFDSGFAFTAIYPVAQQKTEKAKQALYVYLTDHQDTVINSKPFIVPAGHLFVMGDNHAFSQDSRSVEVGFVKEDDIVGKVSHVLVNLYRVWDALWPDSDTGTDIDSNDTTNFRLMKALNH